MEKAVGTAFYRNILREYGRVNQPKLIRGAAVKRKVLLMMESVARGIDRLEAVTKRLDPNTVRALLAKAAGSASWADCGHQDTATHRPRTRRTRRANPTARSLSDNPGRQPAGGKMKTEARIRTEH